MIKFVPLQFLGVSHRILKKNKNAICHLQNLISALVPDILKFKKMCKILQMRLLMMSYTQPNIISVIHAH